VDYSKDQLYTRYYDMYDSYDDEKLKKLLAQHEGRDGKGHKVAVALCRDILAGRGIDLSLEDESLDDGDGDGSQQMQENIDLLRQLSEDENLTEEQKKAFDMVIDMAMAKFEEKPQVTELPDADREAVDKWKAGLKKLSDKELEILKKASDTDGDRIKSRAIDEILDERHPKAGAVQDVTVKPRPRPDINKDPGYNTVKKGKEDAQNKYLEALKKERPYEVARKAREESLRGEGLDEDSEKRHRKRQRVARLIANIGDILQGFANLAGTAYGAQSSKLSSLSERADTGAMYEDSVRQKRRDAIEKEYKDAITKIDKQYDKDISELYEQAQKANERYNKYIDAYNTAEHNYEIAIDKVNSTAKSQVKVNDVKQKQGVEAYGKKQQTLTTETNKRNEHKGNVQMKVDNNKSKKKLNEILGSR